MDWLRQVNNYCERTDASYWSEPVNALTNLSFLIAAYICLRAARRAGDGAALALVASLAAIGVGSYLFHTHAQVWAALADVTPILIFILTYVYLATVRFFGTSRWVGLAVTGLFLPYAALVSTGLGAIFGDLNGSMGYVPVPILIGLYALALRNRDPETARGLAIGAGILAVSLTFRTVDYAVCGAIPLGTHFLWHILNGVMLGWMILVMIRAGERRKSAPNLA